MKTIVLWLQSPVKCTRISISRNGNDLRQLSFWYRALSCGADWFTKGFYIWVTNLHINVVPTITCYATSNPQVKNEWRAVFRPMFVWLSAEFFLPLFAQFSKKQDAMFENRLSFLDSFKVCDANRRMDLFPKTLTFWLVKRESIEMFDP